MPEGPRSTALDPDLLTAEIGLLLDYLSGLPERILTSPQHGHLPPDCATYDQARGGALSRAMMVMLGLAVTISLSIATFAAYIYLGNAKVTNLTNIKAQFKSLDEEIPREEILANHPPKTAVLSY